MEIIKHDLLSVMVAIIALYCAGHLLWQYTNYERKIKELKEKRQQEEKRLRMAIQYWRREYERSHAHNNQPVAE